jgi:predicted Zn-dependent protease
MWIEHGVLTHLAYGREMAISKGENLGRPNSGAFRMSGGTTTIEEMIATTKRGILVTRFDTPTLLHFTSQLYRGYTRDGLWLIENGRISHPIKNLAFTESILFALNNVEQLGVPQRVFRGGPAEPFDVPTPAIVPPLKIRDFSFTALTDAV